MTVVIDIGHPAHVHLFKNFAFAFQNLGHIVLFAVRSKELEIELLKAYNFRYIILGIFKFDIKLLSAALK